MSTPSQPAILPEPAVQPSFPGFDTSIYPGDHSMSVWKQSSPYAFVAYYLKAPCHHSASWMGHRAALIEMGWNLLPVYVGQQVAGVSPCTSSMLTAAQGELDALDAGSKLAEQGFADGTYVYLDVERADSVPAGLADYVSAWVSKIAEGAYRAGVYCHKHNAASIRDAFLAALIDPAELQLRFWIVGGVASEFDIDTSKPTDVGVDFANIWQRPISAKRTFNGVAIDIDENVSQWADPAGPIPT